MRWVMLVVLGFGAAGLLLAEMVGAQGGAGRTTVGSTIHPAGRFPVSWAADVWLSSSWGRGGGITVGTEGVSVAGAFRGLADTVDGIDGVPGVGTAEAGAVLSVNQDRASYGWRELDGLVVNQREFSGRGVAGSPLTLQGLLMSAGERSKLDQLRVGGEIRSNGVVEGSPGGGRGAAPVYSTGTPRVLLEDGYFWLGAESGGAATGTRVLSGEERLYRSATGTALGLWAGVGQVRLVAGASSATEVWAQVYMRAGSSECVSGVERAGVQARGAWEAVVLPVSCLLVVRRGEVIEFGVRYSNVGADTLRAFYGDGAGTWWRLGKIAD